MVERVGTYDISRMGRRTHMRLGALAAGLLWAFAPPAGAQLALPLLETPAPVRVVAPVAASSEIDPPEGPARGTMILVHAGGWAGHDAHAKDVLIETPGRLLIERAWRIVSIDYEEGTDGLQDVLDAVDAEVARATGPGPLCLYGESSGAHLALVASSRRRVVDCVIGLGTPTDLLLYERTAAISGDRALTIVANQLRRLFGTTAEELAPWDIVKLAPTIHADVVLLREADDMVVSQVHSDLLRAVRPATIAIELDAGDPRDASARFLHGTLSAGGRAGYEAAIGSAADRAVAARTAERRAARLGCAGVDRSIAEIGMPKVLRALRCIARRDARRAPARTSRWSRTTVMLRGEINAARVWAALRATAAGRRALAVVATGRVKLVLRPGERSQIVLRRTRTT